MSKNRYVYAVTIEWHRDDGDGLKLYDTGVSTLAYDNLEDAQAFLRSRCNEISEYGWVGCVNTKGCKSIYKIRELMVERSKR